MGLFRSETIHSGTLVLPADSARDYLDTLAREVHIQFEAVPESKLTCQSTKLARIDKLLKIVRGLRQDLKKALIENPDSDALTSIEYDIDGIVYESGEKAFLEYDRLRLLTDIRNNTCSFQLYETQLHEIEVMFDKHRKHNERLELASTELINEMEVDKLALDFQPPTPQSSSDSNSDALILEHGHMHFSAIGGVISAADKDRFERALFRLMRGNLFYNFKWIEDGKKRYAFVAYVQGAQNGPNVSRVLTVAKAFGASTYNWPMDANAARARIAELDNIAKQNKSTAHTYQSFLLDAAKMLTQHEAGHNAQLTNWELYLIKEKMIYEQLSKFVGLEILRARIFYPADETNTVRGVLQAASQLIGKSALLLTDDNPESSSSTPTYIKYNEFTAVSQKLINTYGIPAYKENNPALITTITFPFLFGIMYGDIGHGVIMLLAGIWACTKTSRASVGNGFYEFRYFLLFMGLFATFAGFMYNDFLSLGFNLFGTRFNLDGTSACQSVISGDNKSLAAPHSLVDKQNCGPYPFGLDPMWNAAENELSFVNSLKMKLSVLIGVAQMLLGIMLKWGNSIFHKRYTELFCECVPQLLLLLAIFGYMDFLIMYKWVTPHPSPPGIINTLINMGLMQGDYSNPMYNGQEGIEKYLLILALICVPWMLIPKPIIEAMKHKEKKPTPPCAPSQQFLGTPELLVNEEEAVEEFDIGEVVIHQVIETIEFVLGTVSHTASYLRLWALSLAHQQLALVFFSKTILAAMSTNSAISPLYVMISYVLFVAITAAVLLAMDVLECFLHTLRLHWVEFQSKFFKGTGVEFDPLHISAISKMIVN